MPFSLYKTLENDLDIDPINKHVSVIPTLPKKNYDKVKAILTRLGGSWSSSSQVFSFKKCPQALINRVLQVGSRQLNKFHFYPTPEEIFDYITNFTALSYFGASRDVVRVLEPSCGEGGLIRQLEAYGKLEGRNFVIDGYDIDPLNVIFCQEAGWNVKQADFLTIKPSQDYDLALLNPPFNGDEFIKHIRHAQKFLKKDGLLISVVPTEWINNSVGKSDREWLLEQAQIDSASDLDEANFFAPGTFKGVSIDTAVISLRSVEEAERVLTSDRYKKQSVEAFDFYIDNNEKYWDQLHCLKLKSLGLYVCESEENEEPFCEEKAWSELDRMVAEILNETDPDTVHLVKRFHEDYHQYFIATWFPRPETEDVAVSEPVQLEFGLFAA